MSKLIVKMGNVLPASLKDKLKRLGIHKLFSPFMGKGSAELAFQAKWAREFVSNSHLVLEYWNRYRYLEDIISICELDSDKKVLDVGCGISSVLHFIEGERYGIDPLAEEYLQIYSYPPGITVKKGYGEKIPFGNGFFDVVFCSNVLDHVDNSQKTVREIWRVLKKYGYFVLTVEIFEQRIKREPMHPHTLLKEDITSLMNDKFKIVLERESPWIGLRSYVRGIKTHRNNELISILKKI